MIIMSVGVPHHLLRHRPYLFLIYVSSVPLDPI